MSLHTRTIQIPFSDLSTGWESPNQMIAHLADDRPGVYDVLAAQAEFRRRISGVLPTGWTLSGDRLSGPCESPDGMPDHLAAEYAPLGDVYDLMTMPAMDEDYYIDLIEPYRIGPDTTSVMYGTWQQTVGDPLRVAAQNAGTAWINDHIEDVIDSGQYDEEKLLRGRYFTPEHAEQAAAVFRQEFNATAPEGLTIQADDDIYGPYPRREIDIRGTVRRWQQDRLMAIAGRCLGVTVREVLTADQVAVEIGVASAATARKTLSRWGVPAVRYVPGPGGSIEARYDAAQVRQAAANRPGRGARTDLHP